MSESQKFIARNRAPRVQIEYDVELYGAEKKVQLPFVMGVMSDLAGKSEQPAVADRQFLEIDVDNFDDRMRAMAPRAQFSVPNTLTGEGAIAIDLTFESMSDFSPEAIAAKVEGLAPLLEARKQLSNLMAYMDGKSGAEALIEQVLNQPAMLQALAGQTSEASDMAAALESLRAQMPADAPEENTADETLANLAAKAPEEVIAENGAGVLDALKASAPADAPQADDASEVLAAMAAKVPADTEPDTAAEDVLSGIERVEAEEVKDRTADVLASIQPVNSEAPEEDQASDVLAGIERVEATETEDEAARVLAGLEVSDDAPTEDTSLDVLAGIERVEATEETNQTDNVLAGLEAPETTKPDERVEDVLSGIEAIETAAEDDTSAEVLAGIERRETAEAADTSDAVLAGIEAVDQDEEKDNLEDILGNIEAVEEEAHSDTAADVLAGLDAPVAEEDKDDIDDILAGLDEVEETEVEDSTAAVLSEIEAPEPEDEGQSAADILAELEPVEISEDADDIDDVLADIAPIKKGETEGANADDILAELEPVEVGEEDTDQDDILAGIEPVEIEEDGTSDLDDVLSGIESISEEADGDDLADVLASVDTVEPGEEDTSLDEILANIEEAPEAEAEGGIDEVLASVEATDIDQTNSTEVDDVLSAIESGEEPEDEDLDALLSGLDAGETEDSEDTAASLTEDRLTEPLSDVSDDEDSDYDLDALLSGLDDDNEDEADEGDDLDELMSDLSDDEDNDDDLDALLSGLDDDNEDEADEGDDLDELMSDLSDDEDSDDDLDALLSGLDDDEEGEADEGDDLDELMSDLSDDEDSDDDLDALLAGLDDDESTAEGSDDLDDLLGDLSDDDDGDAQPTEEDTPEPPQSPFGTISAPKPERQSMHRPKFRMALFGDFTGRAARGVMEIGDDLAARTPTCLDVDTVEDIIESFATTLTLPVGKDGMGVEVKLGELDDLHPDELYENVEIFEALNGLRQQLGVGSMAANAQAQLTAWGEAHGTPIKLPKRSSSTSVPANLKLSDFQALIGDTSGTLAQKSPAEDIIARVVGPHIVKAPDAGATAMLAAVDAAISSAMRLILHHPDFQAVEAQWRSLDMLARRIETDSTLEIVLFDISAEELAVDLAANEDLAESGLYRLLNAALDPEEGQGGFSALFGLYTFEETPPHAELLARIGLVASHMDAPFFTAMTPGYLDTPKEDRHPLVAEAWDALRGLPEAGYLGLASPRFLLRLPYGQKTEPCYEFEFEEFTPQEGLSGMLWANPVVLVAILLAATYKKDGKGLNLGSLMSLGDLPYYYVNDRHGDQVALPCTERNLSSDAAQLTLGRGFMPVLWMKGRNEVRLGSFRALSGEEIEGAWTGLAPRKPKASDDAVQLSVGAKSKAPARASADQTSEAGDDEDDDDMSSLFDSDDDDGDGGLDDLMSGFGDDDDDDGSLDDLLAGFDDEDDDDDGDDDEMDPELAALLEGL